MDDVLEMVELSTVRGGPMWVTPHATVGPFAVHRAVNGGTGWTVTHIPTGKRVWTTTTFALALRVATYLDSERTIPEEAEATEAWLRALTPSARTRLVAILQGIAPRVLP